MNYASVAAVLNIIQSSVEFLKSITQAIQLNALIYASLYPHRGIYFTYEYNCHIKVIMRASLTYNIYETGYVPELIVHDGSLQNCTGQNEKISFCPLPFCRLHTATH